MTNTGGTPAGWYYAAGDPEGTQRYWDGAQWIGEPQPVPQAQTPTPPAAPAAPATPPIDDQTVQYRPPTQEAPPTGFGTPGGQQPDQQFGGQAPGGYAPPGGGQAAPDYSSQGVAQGGAPNYGAPAGGPPPGYQGYAPASATPGTAAEWGPRAIAYLIDIAPIFAAYVVILVGALISDALGVLLAVVGYIAIIGYGIWNFYVTQGKTGQTIGKEKQGLKLVKDETGQPVGGGMAFVRYLIIGLLGGFTCGIYLLLDVLWPLWDPEKKRLTDKMLNMSVIVA